MGLYLERPFHLSGARVTGRKQFDEDAAIRRATELFRRKGYASSSIDDLVQTTRISRSSLYGTFGNKEQLFLSVMSRYCTRMMARLAPQNDLPPADAMRSFLLSLLDALDGWGRPGGCLVTNTCAEYGNTTRSVQQMCKEALAEQEAQLREYFTLAQSRGDLPAGADIDQLSSFYMSMRHSIGVLWRAGESKQKLTSIIDASISVIPHRLPPSSRPRRSTA
jgi:TetR/AcrR family transcriptional repressor of nem operon